MNSKPLPVKITMYGRGRAPLNNCRVYFTIRFFLLTLVCLFSALCLNAQDCIPMTTNVSQGQNYILETVPRIAGYNPATTGYSTCNVMQTVQYFDGLGRPVQTIAIKGSAQLNDVVQPIAYDAYGREPVKYLPYVSVVNDGSYKPDALAGSAGYQTSDQYNFYNSPPASTGVSPDPYPSASTSIEPSPLNRVLEQGAPGASWQLTGTTVTSGYTSGHTIKVIYANNDGVTYWAQQYNVAVGTGSARALSYVAKYGTDQLYVTITQDENWPTTQTIDTRLNTTEEYKNKDGRVVLKRTYNLIGSSTIQVLSTYYVYDDLGNLCFVLPPLAGGDAAANISQTVLNNYCYQYQYDSRNRITGKKIPGKGWEYTVYNITDQPVATQDSLQRFAKEWIYTKYDGKGREIMTGIWTNGGTAISQAGLQTAVYAVSALWETPLITGNGYTTAAWPASQATPLTIDYYDSYAGIPNWPGYAVPSGAEANVHGLPVASQVAVLNTLTNGTPSMLWTEHYYDGRDRNTLTYRQHYFGGVASINNFDAITTTYNFNNQPSSITRQHWNTSSTTTPLLTIANQYIYDHMGSKLETWEQITNGSNAPNPANRYLISQVAYNEIGQLWSKNLHSTDSVNFLQNIAYAYNERGWLLNSNSPVFEERLQYNQVTGVTGISPLAQYNGNIASQSWGTATAPNSSSFVYSYDVLNRLTQGRSADNKYIERGISYDMMGNINTLSRVYNSVLIDSMTYTYNSTNQLQSVYDKSPDAGTIGYKTGNWTYAYDGNGNMATDNSKGIGQIIYNLLNLPQSIAALNTTYTYDADGQKLRRVIGTVTTDYIDGIEYDSGALTFIQTEEGRALPNGTTLYNYEYSLSDHLGDERVTFDSHTTTPTIVQQDNYMPFGMDISVGSVVNPQNNYLYNKKELQQNLQQYDYVARLYDPVIGRWTKTDGKAELYFSTSPYVYALNQPTNAIDPDGKVVIFINGLYVGHQGDSFGKIDASYWRGDVTYTSQNGLTRTVYREFDTWAMTQLNDEKALYFDGQRGGPLSASFRESAGLFDGRRQVKSIIANLAKDPQGNIVESIKIITHSLGAAYGKGFVKALKEYIKTLPPAIQKQIKIDLVADFDPFQAGDLRADPNILTMQFIHARFWNFLGFGGLANEKEPGAIVRDTTDEDDSSDHNILTFLYDISYLTPGTYVWDKNTKTWVQAPPQN
jgi:RHS repeat-associated protein